MDDLKQRITRLQRQRRKALEKHADAVRTATAELDNVLERVDRRLDQLKTWAHDPPVLVRNGPGPAVEVYHSLDDPCGKVNPVMVEAGRFDVMPLGEAVNRGLRPCSACGSQLRGAA